MQNSFEGLQILTHGLDYGERDEEIIVRLINDRTLFKILVERNGILLSITTKNRAFFFFLSSVLIGMRVAPTTDPYPGIVEISNYEIYKIVRDWNEMSNIKLGKKLTR